LRNADAADYNYAPMTRSPRWPTSIRHATFALVATVVIALARCGGSNSTPTTPSATSTPQFSLSGTVYNALSGNTFGVAGATLQIATGPNSGRSTTTDSSGRYHFDGLTGGNMSIRLSAANYAALSRDIIVTSDGTLDFAMSPTIVATSGRVIDAVSQAGLAGVTINGGAVSLQSELFCDGRARVDCLAAAAHFRRAVLSSTPDVPSRAWKRCDRVAHCIDV
jgi:hypothetical protein